MQRMEDASPYGMEEPSPGMSQRLLLQFRLVPFSISPHTAKGRLKHLCAFLVPSLWLINYVLPQRGAQRGAKVCRVGAPPKTPDPEWDPLTQ